MDLLCIDFSKADPSKTGKENIFILTDVFTKLSQVFITPNQKAFTVTKYWGTSGFMYMVFLHEFIVTKASVSIIRS